MIPPGRRGGTSVAVIVLPLTGVVAGSLLSIGLSPWAIVAIAGGGGILGGLVVFFHNKLWGSLVLQKLAQIERQFGTVTDETSIVSGELYHLRAEVSAIRRALNISPPGTHPPPDPTRTEQP